MSPAIRRPLLCLALTTPAVLAAQQPAARASSFAFTIDNIMRGPEVYGREPQRPRFTADGRWIYFRWLPPGTDWREQLRPYRVRAAAGATPEVISEAAWDSTAPAFEHGPRSPDGRFQAVSSQGDLYLVELRTGTIRRITETAAAETEPSFSTDGRRMYFARENNAYSVELDGGLTRQLTDIRTGPAPKPDSTPGGQRGVLRTQQRVLLEAIRDRLRADSIAKAQREAREKLRPKALYLRERERIARLLPSPNGKALLIVTETAANGSQQTRVPNYVTISGYTEDLTVRTKVGDVEPSGRVAYMRLPDGEVKWLQIVPGDTSRPPGDVEVAGWSDDGSRALVVAISRDFKTRVVSTIGVDSGRVRAIDTLKDSAWVGGPCVECAGWFDGGRRIWFVSEGSGYAHLYSTDANGGGRSQLTRGRWEVLDVQLAPDRREFWMHTSETSPYERHLWRMATTGGARTRITTRRGGHTVAWSNDGRLLADVFSEANRPPELFLVENTPNATMAQLTTSPTREWLSFPWIRPAIIDIRAGDGVNIPARIYRPADMGAQPNGGAVIFVHGAGYLHNVHNYWSSYAREYMFNQYLASKGYVVLDVDYRASAGYGRDWRTAIYRHMGGRDLADHIDASKWLQREHRIDPERIGIYGGSYGGFITLMALFTSPKEFGAGAALRSVTDWAHYNHGYTARILNTPESDTLSFRRSSPIYFAEGLEDPLLIAHGMVDVNVHFQDVVRLAQRLIELRKTGWELAVYPVEDHAFIRPTSWADEYQRIYDLFEREIARPRSAAAQGGTP